MATARDRLSPTSSWKLDVVALIISVLSLIVASYAGCQSQRQADIALTSFNRNIETSERMAKEKELFDWQSYTIHSIIDKHSSSTELGLSFDEIKKEFIDIAAQRQSEVPKQAIQDEQLDRVIIHLRSSGQIYKTHDNRYMADMTEPLYGFGRSRILSEAGEEMIAYLARNGPSDAATLRTVVEKFRLSNQEFFFCLSSYVERKLIFVNKDGKFQSILDATIFPENQE